MRKRHWLRFVLLCTAVVVSAVGCSSSDQSVDVVSFELGDLLEPFDPPSLAELEASTTWVDQPVLDGMDLMREYQATWGPPPLSAKEALDLRNRSDEDNEEILNTLSRLAPPDDSGVDTGATFLRATNGDLKSTNPLLASANADQEFGGLTGIGLFSFDWNFTPYASKNVVVSWQSSEDRLMDKIVMRDDLVWSDGTPITAHDAQFTFEAMMTDAVIVPAVRQGKENIRWVQAYDDHTLVFFHKEAQATNAWNMFYSFLPKHIYEKTILTDPTMARSDAHTKLEDNPVVGGPYKLSKRVRGQEFVLERREEYYMHDGKQVRAKPYFQTIHYKTIDDPNTSLLALKSGHLDDHQLTAEQWVGQSDSDEFYRFNTKVTAPAWISYYVTWNLQTPFFEDDRVRWAMTYAFDYDEMVDKLFHGLYEQSRGTFHPTSWMFPKEDPPEPVVQDLAKAEQLLDEAGWRDSDNDGIRDKEINGRVVPFRFTMLVHQTPNAINIGTLWKECLSRIGIECISKPTEFTVLIQMLRDHKYQASLGVWGTGADPDTTENIFLTGQGRNYGQYSNPQVDELFHQAKYEIDREARGTLYGEITKQLWEDQPYTWLLYRNGFYGFNKRLRGYNFSPRGPYLFDPGINSVYMTDQQP